MNQQEEYARALQQQHMNSMQNLQTMHGMYSKNSYPGGSAQSSCIPQSVKLTKEKSMFKEVVADIKGFILEHRGIIYFVVIALVVDHFFFNGAFKARLQAMADKMVTKVEEKIK